MTRKSGSRVGPRRSAETVSRVRPIAERFAGAHGLVLWSVSFTRAAGRETLRIAADRVGGVASDELAIFAEDLGRELDHADAVPGDAPYVLEVTSPGAERTLHGSDHFRVCRGLVVRVKFGDGRPPIDGVIGDSDSSGVDIETEGGSRRIRYEEIDRAQLRVTEIG